MLYYNYDIVFCGDEIKQSSNEALICRNVCKCRDCIIQLFVGWIYGGVVADLDLSNLTFEIKFRLYFF